MWFFFGLIGILVVFLLWRIWHAIDLLAGMFVYAVNETALRSGQEPILLEDSLKDGTPSGDEPSRPGRSPDGAIRLS